MKLNLRETSFIHIRNQTPSGKPSNKGGTTICYIIDRHTGFADIGVALCCQKDNFNRKRGRDIAEGRALISATKRALTTKVPLELVDLDPSTGKPKASRSDVITWVIETAKTNGLLKATAREGN